MFNKIFLFICTENLKQLSEKCGIKNHKNLYTIKKKGLSKTVFNFIYLQNFYHFDLEEIIPEKCHEFLLKYKKYRGLSYMKLSHKTGISSLNLINLHKRTPLNLINFIKIVQYYQKTIKETE